MIFQYSPTSKTSNNDGALYGLKWSLLVDFYDQFNRKIANKRGKVRELWSLVYFLGSRISEIADKKTANYEGRQYNQTCVQRSPKKRISKNLLENESFDKRIQYATHEHFTATVNWNWKNLIKLLWN